MSDVHKRKAIRKRATQVMMVIDSFTGETVGRVGNLSDNGMMLIAQKEMPDEYFFQVQLTLQTPGAASQKLEVGFQSMWCEQARAANTYWIGCKFIDISDEGLAGLKSWLEKNEEVVH